MVHAPRVPPDARGDRPARGRPDRVLRRAIGSSASSSGSTGSSSARCSPAPRWGPSTRSGWCSRRSLGGIVGALILIAAYFVGVALLGAGVGALAASLIWACARPRAACARGDPVRDRGRARRARAAALRDHRRHRVRRRMDRHRRRRSRCRAIGPRPNAAARNNVWLAYPMHPAPGQQWVLFAWIGLGLVGAIVQLGVTAKGKK